MNFGVSGLDSHQTECLQSTQTLADIEERDAAAKAHDPDKH